VWATDDHVLGEYIYTTFDTTDYTSFTGEYCYCAPSACSQWIPLDFGKPNLEIAKPVRGTWMSKATSLYSYEDANVCSYYLQVVPPVILHTNYGAPSSIWMRTNFTKNGDSVILMDFFVYDKHQHVSQRHIGLVSTQYSLDQVDHGQWINVDRPLIPQMW